MRTLIAFAVIVVLPACAFAYNTDDPNLARTSEYVSEVAFVCDSNRSGSASSVEDCARSYGLGNQPETVEALFLVDSVAKNAAVLSAPAERVPSSLDRSRKSTRK